MRRGNERLERQRRGGKVGLLDVAEATIREAVADERVGNAGGVFQKARIRRRDPQRGQREKRFGVSLRGAVAAVVALKR